MQAVVRFELWGPSAAAVEADTLTLMASIGAQEVALRAAGFLKIDQESAAPAEFIAGLNTWRKAIEYALLFEYSYEDTDGADSLIAHIPVDLGLDAVSLPEEGMVLKDHMVRWDTEAAPTLRLTGPAAPRSISALSFVAGAAPTGQVIITRTSEGAPGLPLDHVSFADFLDAITDPAVSPAHDRFTFASVTTWLAEFSSAGDAIELGDWNTDAVTDAYDASILTFPVPVALADASQRLEIAFENPAFDRSAVLYMQAR